MIKNNIGKDNILKKAKSFSKRALNFSLRWLYLILLLGVAAYSFSVWDRFVINSEWSDEKKQEYVKGQAVFSFGKSDYLKLSELLKSKKDNLEKYEGYKGRDIFHPEGF